jgi:hypothetical protein
MMLTLVSTMFYFRKYYFLQLKIFYYFRSTAELENFQNLILMYASKRHSYTPPAYRCRNLLAALDHNGHIDREVMTNKDGSIRL